MSLLSGPAGREVGKEEQGVLRPWATLSETEEELCEEGKCVGHIHRRNVEPTGRHALESLSPHGF